MHPEIAGAAWLIIVAGGAAALAVALIISGAMWLARDRSQGPHTDRATEEMYADEEDEPVEHDEPVA